MYYKETGYVVQVELSCNLVYGGQISLVMCHSAVLFCCVPVDWLSSDIRE